MGQRLTSPTSIHEDTGSIPGLDQGVKASGAAVSCGVDCRRDSHLVLPWLWRRPAARAPIRLLTWKPPFAAGANLKREREEKKEALG